MSPTGKRPDPEPDPDLHPDLDIDLDLDRALREARQAARKAGALLQQGSRRGFSVQQKGEVDLVTDCDRASEALVVEALSRAFPGHRVVGEEGLCVQGRGEEASCPSWYVDPLDGTTNFAHGLPLWAVSIGLELAGEALLGVVCVPELDWELWAARGRGAWHNDRQIRVSRTATLDGALVATGFPYDRRTSPENNVPQLASVIRRCQGIRRMGVASIDCALVAMGHLDAYWEPKLKPWDISAGAALVREAGGRVTNMDGSPFRSTRGHILATNGLVHEEMLRALAAASGPGHAT